MHWEYVIFILQIAAVVYLLYVVFDTSVRMKRNHAVCEFRLEMLEKIHKMILMDPQGSPWAWRYKIFEEVPYDAMVRSRKKLEPGNFYSDLSFLEPYESGRSPVSDPE